MTFVNTKECNHTEIRAGCNYVISSRELSTGRLNINKLEDLQLPCTETSVTWAPFAWKEQDCDGLKINQLYTWSKVWYSAQKNPRGVGTTLWKNHGCHLIAWPVIKDHRHKVKHLCLNPRQTAELWVCGNSNFVCSKSAILIYYQLYAYSKTKWVH